MILAFYFMKLTFYFMKITILLHENNHFTSWNWHFYSLKSLFGLYFGWKITIIFGSLYGESNQWVTYPPSVIDGLSWSRGDGSSVEVHHFLTRTKPKFIRICPLSSLAQYPIAWTDTLIRICARARFYIIIRWM